MKLYSALSTEFVGGSEGLDVRQSLTVARVFSILCDYYWVERESEDDSIPGKKERVQSSVSYCSLRVLWSSYVIIIWDNIVRTNSLPRSNPNWGRCHLNPSLPDPDS